MIKTFFKKNVRYFNNELIQTSNFKDKEISVPFHLRVIDWDWTLSILTHYLSYIHIQNLRSLH